MTNMRHGRGTMTKKKLRNPVHHQEIIRDCPKCGRANSMTLDLDGLVCVFCGYLYYLTEKTLKEITKQHSPDT